jgi:hypothetical protein
MAEVERVYHEMAGSWFDNNLDEPLHFDLKEKL